MTDDINMESDKKDNLQGLIILGATKLDCPIDAEELTYLTDLYYNYNKDKEKSLKEGSEMPSPGVLQQIADAGDDSKKTVEIYASAGDLALMKAVSEIDAGYLPMAINCFVDAAGLADQIGLKPDEKRPFGIQNKVISYYHILTSGMAIGNNFDYKSEAKKIELNSINGLDIKDNDTPLA